MLGSLFNSCWSSQNGQTHSNNSLETFSGFLMFSGGTKMEHWLSDGATRGIL